MAKAKGGVRATLKEIWTRIIKVEGKTNPYYINGENDSYPSEIEAVINASPTGIRAAKTMQSFIAGAGLLNEAGLEIEPKDYLIVNRLKNLSIMDVVRIGAGVLAYQNGCFFHIKFKVQRESEESEDFKIVPSGIDVLNYPSCRAGKRDDDGVEGRFYIKHETDSKTDSKKDKWFYPYSKDQDVLKSQIYRDFWQSLEKGNDIKNMPDIEDLEAEHPIEEAIRQYRGAIFFLNLMPELEYPLSNIHASYNEADSENRITQYTNGQTRSGFVGKTAIVTLAMDDEDSEQLKQDFGEFLGSENSHHLFHLEVDSDTDFDKVIKFIQVPAQYDDKLFVATDARIQRNVLGAFKNVPPSLVNSSDGAMFSSSGDAYEQMKIFYSEQTKHERDKLEQTLCYLGFPVKLKPIAEAKIIDTQQPDKEAL